MKPKISIIIPTYNDPTYLEKSVRSVLNQDYPKNKYEILIIDGSTNESISDLYKNKFSRIRIIRYIRKKGCNLPEALNIGIENMRGKFFKQLDVDDLLMKNSLSRYDRYVNENPEFMVFYSDVKLIDENGSIIGEEREKSYEGMELARRIWNGTIGYPSSYIINKECFRMVGTFNAKTTMAEDWEWRMKAIFINKLKFYHIPEELIGYRRHENQKSNSELLTNSVYIWKMKKRIIYEFKQKIKDQELLDLKVSYSKLLMSIIKRNMEVTFGLYKNMKYKKIIKKLEDIVGGI